ncbi:MAG: SDR family oxidoreductase [Alphaproteobacteria bacterium]|nr:SDR family oxidoreductase [Alphaproteobacteria bacterium]
MTTVTVIGKNSNLAQFLAKKPETADWVFMSHEDVKTREAEIRSSDVVINFAVHPDVVAKGEVTPETDLDSQLAEMLADTPAHFIMASSRKVYGEHPEQAEITVESALSPEDPYGAAKKQIEDNVRARMPEDRLTVLRLTNIVGWNHKDLSQKGFAGFVFNEMCAKGGTVELEYDPDCLRDFLPQDKFCEVMIALADNPKSGTFNLGSGRPMQVGKLVTAWTSGFGGEGMMLVDRDQERYQDFYLNSDRIYNSTGVSAMSEDDIIDTLKAEGRALYDWRYPEGMASDADELVWGLG